jgi:hypothetical protein
LACTCGKASTIGTCVTCRYIALLEAK